MVSIVVLNFNGEKYLKTCMESVLKLSYPKKEVIFLDNASTDNSLEFVKRRFPHIRAIANGKNLGYSGGANLAIRQSKGDEVVILNPDIIFENDYLDVLMKRMHADPHIGAIIGKLLKYDFHKNQKTQMIDSAGLLMHRNRRCVDRGQGVTDTGQFDLAEEVFGVTGACPLYRRKALENVKIFDEYFDGDFFMYKEDVDLSWRMRLFGWKCFYEPDAIAYHGRGTGVFDRTGIIDAVGNRKNLSKFQRYYSYKNERLTRVKNELLPIVLRDVLHIAWKELLMAGWILLREQFLIKSFFYFIWQMPGAFKKRREIMRKKKLHTAEMEKWFI